MCGKRENGMKIKAWKDCQCRKCEGLFVNEKPYFN